MSNEQNSVHPADFLADNEDVTVVNGVAIRKGSIGAFLKNISILNRMDLSDQQRSDIINILGELAPAMVAVGLYEHATFKNETVQQILEEASKDSM